jgi:hypothetical protein
LAPAAWTGIAFGTLAMKKNKVIFRNKTAGQGVISSKCAAGNNKYPVAETAVEMMMMV